VNQIIFDGLKPSLTYSPIRIGETQLFFDADNKIYRLFHKNKQWMSLDLIESNQLKDQYIELNLACGKVVTTGLGLGLRETYLSSKANVKEIIVFEKNLDVIKMFNFFARKSNFDTSKITIINDDAKNALNVDCDWLLLDHYEPVHQVFWEIIDDVRYISKNCIAKQIFFWPFLYIYCYYCIKKDLDVTKIISYNTFIDQIKIEKMPTNLTEEILSYASIFAKELKNSLNGNSINMS
jgi:hypothetical protein